MSVIPALAVMAAITKVLGIPVTLTPRQNTLAPGVLMLVLTWVTEPKQGPSIVAAITPSVLARGQIGLICLAGQ